MKCPKCGCELYMEYIQSAEGGYNFHVLICCTNDDCDFEEID